MLSFNEEQIILQEIAESISTKMHKHYAQHQKVLDEIEFIPEEPDIYT